MAKEFNCAILSLDSLALYKEIDIASAKPTKKERGEIPHFGIDEIEINTPFNVTLFIELYKKADSFCKKENLNLIIVGGTGFYLKTLIEGISKLPKIDNKAKEIVKDQMYNLKKAYTFLKEIDPSYAKKIKPNDRYRIEKALTIFYQTKKIPTIYFKSSPPKPILTDLTLFEISIDKDLLNRRIEQRTYEMFEMGLVDEVANLEFKYTRTPHPMKAIGIKEVLGYFDGRYKLQDTKELIIIHTRQLAKRQKIFNKTQFPPHITTSAQNLKQKISSLFINHLS